MGVQEVAADQINKYGAIDGIKEDDRTYLIEKMVEKPKVEEAPSNIAILGRYIITPKIFEILETQEPGVGGEIQLTDALNNLLRYEKMYAYEFRGDRYDVGSKMGFLKATVRAGLKSEELREEFLEHLEEIVKNK